MLWNFKDSNVKQSSRNPFFMTILFSSSSNCQDLLLHSQLRTLLLIYLRKLRQSVENCSQAPMTTSAHMPTPVPNTVDHQCVFPLWATSYVLWIPSFLAYTRTWLQTLASVSPESPISPSLLDHSQEHSVTLYQS